MDPLARVTAAVTGLTGEPLPTGESASHIALRVLCDAEKSPVGWSQFNEVLLYCGYGRISPHFFDYLVSGELYSEEEQRPSPKVASIEQLERASERGKQLGLLAFGNVKFGFKNFGQNSQLLRDWVEFLTPITTDRYEHRLAPAIPIQDIDIAKRYLLGYLSAGEIDAGLKARPNDEALLALKAEQAALQEIGKKNQTAYLVSDYLDIYVATSMRERHQFLSVAKFCDALFLHEQLAPLNLRYFDPTLAYAPDRIDKGLSEALMLKRARLTIYLAQETETLGKDSELACTLAQGKVVIAFVPEADEELFAALEKELQDSYPGVGLGSLLLAQLRHFNPKLAWEDSTIQGWLRLPADKLEQQSDEVRARFRLAVKEEYDRKYRTLRDQHPLGFQVKLSDGVAGGVLVVRRLEQCARLVRAVLTGEQVYRIEESKDAGGECTHVCLVETISESKFRVMTKDKTLENAFWNFYLK